MKAGFLIIPTFVAFANPATFVLATHETSASNQNALGRQLNQLDSGNFDRLNELLDNISISIDDDMTVSERVGFIDLNLVVDTLTCRDIRIGNVVINYSTDADDSSSMNSIDVNIALHGIDLACDIEYQYEYGLLKGTKKAEIVTLDNAADTSIEFISYDENDDFLITSSVTNCVVNIEISDFNFVDADFATSVVGLFERFLRELIEKEIEGYACSQLSTTGVTFLNDNIFTAINEKFMDFATLEDPDAIDETSLQSNKVNVTGALNFREIAETQIGDLFQRALSQLDQILGSQFETNDELGINALLRSYILDEKGALVLDITKLLGKDALQFELHNELTQSIITFKELRIDGLDSMTKFDPLVVVDDYILRNEFSWRSLNMQIDLVLDMKPSSLEEAILELDVDSEMKGIVEEITISVGAENVDVLSSLFALIDVEALGSITIGSLLSLTNGEDYAWLLPCLTSAIQELHFVELEISPQQINPPTLEGFIDDGLDSILSDLAEISFEMYHDLLVKETLPIVVRSTLKTFANDLIAKILEGSGENTNACPKFDEVAADEYVDFREFFGLPNSITIDSEYGKLPSMLRDLMDQELLAKNPATDMPKINEIMIDPLTRGQSGTEGTLLLVGNGDDMFNVGQRIKVGGFDTNIRLSASDVKIENLDTVVSPLILLEPVPTDPFLLNNSVTVGVEDRPVKLAGKFDFAMIDNVKGVEISNKIEMSFDMHTANVLATLMLKIAKSKLLGFPLVDAFDLNCWIATIPAPTLNEQGVRVGDDELNATIADFAASVGNLNLNVTCVECSSPDILMLSELLMSSGEAQNNVTSLVNQFLSFAGDLVKGDLMQVQIDRLLNDASKRCRHSPNYDPNFPISGISSDINQYSDFEAVQIKDSTTYLMLVGVVSLALILVVVSLIYSIRFFTRRRHIRWLATLPMEQVEALKHVRRIAVSLESALNSMTHSMFQSGEDIPSILRYGMPIIIIGNIALFLSGHLNLGATVNIDVTVVGETIKVDKFFEFSMAKSTIDIWNSGGKELAILILIFSGIWPYTKQLITLVLWFVPTSWVPVSRRGSILIWLDWMAKWSMIDIFVLIICLAAFRVSVDSPSEFDFLTDGLYSFDLLVVPLWGLYANLIAQLVSQISSHFIIHYHRKITKRACDSYSQSSTNRSLKTREDSEQNVMLHTHQFGRPHRGEEEKLIVRTWVNYALILSALLSNVCIIAGCILPSFSIEVFGLLGVAVEAGQEFRDAKTYHSVFTVTKLLFDQAKFLDTTNNYVGLTSFSVIFVLTVLLVPILQSLVLLGQWFVPMTRKQRTKISVLVEILQAWQYAEVYIIAIFVASWQLGPISSFMVNEYCDSLDGFFSELVFYGLLKTEDAQCFSVKSVIEEGFFILAVGSILLALINAFVSKATSQYCRDQDEPNRMNEIQEHNSTLESAEAGQEANANDSESTIHPPPVLFTDVFRWLLIPECQSKKTTGDLRRDEPSIGDSCIQESFTEDS